MQAHGGDGGRLVLRLPGSWVQLDPTRPEVTATRIHNYATLTVGRADNLSRTRAQVRRLLSGVLEHSRPRTGLQSLFLCHELLAGVPAPIAIAVFAPADVHLSPVLGTEPQHVIDAFLAAMDALGDTAGWQRRDCVDGCSVRRWRVTAARPDSTGDGADDDGTATSDTGVGTFSATYWRTVPGSKQLMLITVTSVLTQDVEVMVRLADAVVAGSRMSWA